MKRRELQSVVRLFLTSLFFITLVDGWSEVASAQSRTIRAAAAKTTAGPKSSGPRDPLSPVYRPHPAVKPQIVAGGTAAAWITGPLVKVSTSAAPGTAQSLQISAAHNEFESFQVHAAAGANPIQMNVTVSDFTNAQTGDVIASATHVTLYREAYLDITTLSDVNGTAGITPDPLIPTVDPYTGEARTAFPFTVPANSVQSAWIDVRVPTSVPSGYYSATVTVLDGTTVISQLSVVLKVWAFTLPSTATLKSAFGMSWDGFCIQAYGGYNGCSSYPGSGGSSDTAIELTHIAQARLLLDHRLSISSVVYVGPPSGTWAHFDATYGALLNGTAATLLPGAKLTTLQFLPPAADNLSVPVIQNWVAHFTANGWLAPLFHYTCDEPPNGCTWANALSSVQTVHNASPNMKSLITTDIASATQYGLLPDLSIIVPTVDHMDPQGGTNQRSSYNAFLTGNKHLWWYQACSEHGSCSNGIVGPATATWPSYMVDATPVRNRVFQWLAFVDQIEGELYYEIDYCWVYPVCGPGSNSNQPWTSIYAFGGNGDGTLIYPGTPALIGGTTPIPLPSIRLKHIRDGMEDFEYLNALSQAGEGGFASTTAQSFITNAYTFNNDPQALASAREALGDRLHRMALPACSEQAVCSHDFNGDGFSDIAWRDTSGNLSIWLMNGGQVLTGAGLGTVPPSWSIVGQRDFDGSGTYDLLWRDTSGNTAIWFLTDAQVTASGGLGTIPPSWTVIATADFDGDGKGDILWRDTGGSTSMWLMNGAQIASSAGLGNVPNSWALAGTGDFNGDGKADILWQDTAGNLAVWLMNGGQVTSTTGLGNVPRPWSIVGTGDFNGDGRSDLLWQDTGGNTAIWFLNGGQVASTAGLGTIAPPWAVAATGDYNGDGVSDLLWRDSSGNTAIWFFNGGQVQSTVGLGNIPSNWSVQSVNAE